MRLFSFSADFATHIMEKQLAQWYEDYDWSDLELPLSDIEALIGMAKS